MQDNNTRLQLFQDDEEIHINHILNLLYIKNKKIDVGRIRSALSLAISAHTNQFRKSGMPYVEHPIEVAKVLASYGSDTDTIIAGLLHDVVEDTDTALEEIRVDFGDDVAFMVDAVTKITHLSDVHSREEKSAANYRKLLTSTSQDPRVLIIKVADRLHNMRTLNYVDKKSKQVRIAQETMDIYAPLANRFGLSKIKAELEDLSFRYLNHDAHQSIIQQMSQTREEREAYIKELTNCLNSHLKKFNIQCRIQGRPKNLYSIHQKIRNRDARIEDIYDLFAIRVITQTRIDCYKVLGCIHEIWSPVQARFKDYISTPKSNLYQSLHTTVLAIDERLVEIQIRSEEMNQVAEKGFAAHSKYKQKNGDSQFNWLQELVREQREIKDTGEFLEFLKIDLIHHELVVQTPKGQSFTLPSKSTILDFAYYVHTELGNKCIGARVDGRFVPFDQELQYGSSVNILTSNEQHPNREWLNIVKTSKAKQHVRRYLRTEEQNRQLKLGKIILEREVNKRGGELPELKLFSKKFGIENWDEMYAELGEGHILQSELSSFLSEFLVDKRKKEECFLINTHNIQLIQFANCCSPIPGDTLLGLLKSHDGISIHRSSCLEGLSESEIHPEYIFPIAWENDEANDFEVQVEVQGEDCEGLLQNITQTFSDFNISIIRASIETKGPEIRNFFEVKVASLTHLHAAIRKISEIDKIKNVRRL